MKNENLKTKLEVFVCNYKREGDLNCFDRGAKELTDDLKKWAKENHKSDIKVFRSGCVGKCSEGIAIVCYPEKKLLLEVTPADSNKIKEGLKETLKKL